ncbi:type I restriction-modification system methyltransferase subunit [Enterocloster clostridioformis]|uniref:Type I restriction-modification system methyltransferase subunit n=3 Tax=Enterocloster clostridioformis TaxID=1531 RepID=A0A2X2UDF8_9FIRM|nr:type I restriction-modification system methyltransferase subunit [Enterocloster clostridioformis]
MRTEQSFFVPKQEIVDNGYDLSINKYKKTEYVTVEYPSTAEILDKLDTLETEIQKRLIELRGDAMIIKLGSVITEYSERNKNGENIPVNSVTNEQGFCTGYFSKEVASKDKTTYKIGPRGFFAYNPSRINVGSVDWQSCEDRVIVSPLYVVFDVSERIIRSYTTGSVRDNLKFSILSEFPISLPPINEQRRIAATLDKVEETIALRQEELTTLNHKISAPFWILQSAIFVLFSQNHQQYHLYVSWDMSFLQRWSFLYWNLRHHM